MKKHIFLGAASVLASAMVVGPVAGQQVADRSHLEASAVVAGQAKLGVAERARLADQLAGRWATYVEEAYGLQPLRWQARLRGVVMSADALNLRDAMARETFEGAWAALNGRSEVIDDDGVITALAQADGAAPAALGDFERDLVYTPVEPCRLVDTRETGARIDANSSRGFLAWGEDSYAFQGGSPTDCGLADQDPEVVLVSVTAVDPSVAGYATVYAADATEVPLVANVNYLAGAVVNNFAAVKLATNIGEADFRIYSWAQADYVVDIVGYFDAPHATALSCVNVFDSVESVVPDNGVYFTADANIEACPADTTGVGYVWDYITGIGGVAVWDNNYGVQLGLSHASYDGGGPDGNIRLLLGRRCCRVPGR